MVRRKSDETVDLARKINPSRAEASDFGPPSPVAENEARAARVREAVKMAGGNKAVAEKTGISLTTTQNYLKGGEMKLSNALAIAGAAGVSLEWLATGQGPMRPGQAAPPAEPASTAPFRLFGNVDLDRLRRAIEGATASAGGDDRLLLHLIVVLYDQLSELEEPAP